MFVVVWLFSASRECHYTVAQADFDYWRWLQFQLEIQRKLALASRNIKHVFLEDTRQVDLSHNHDDRGWWLRTFHLLKKKCFQTFPGLGRTQSCIEFRQARNYHISVDKTLTSDSSSLTRRPLKFLRCLIDFGSPHRTNHCIILERHLVDRVALLLRST